MSRHAHADAGTRCVCAVSGGVPYDVCYVHPSPYHYAPDFSACFIALRLKLY